MCLHKRPLFVAARPTAPRNRLARVRSPAPPSSPGQPRGGVATIATDDRRWEPLLAAGITYAAMAAMFGDATDWSACTALLAAGGVGALVSCACAMADDEPTAEDAAAAWGAQQDTRRAATVTWDGDKHPPAPTHKAGVPRAWGVAAPATKTSFWAASAPEPEEPLAEPVTFEQATGAARLEAARRCRAAEVTESERQFMREFTAMMAAGLVVVLRVDSDGVAVTLSLQEFRNEPILEWHFTETGERGRLSLSDIQTVRGQQLNDELARRSFVIEGRDRVLVFHAETPDICALVIDGLAMLVADHKRRAARRRSSLGPARKAIAARRSSPKKPLAAKN